MYRCERVGGRAKANSSLPSAASAPPKTIPEIAANMLPVAMIHPGWWNSINAHPPARRTISPPMITHRPASQ
jgi:hypothetical protein